MSKDIWYAVNSDGAIVAAAIHDGHEARDEVAALFALDSAGRRREEDPYTGKLTGIVPTRVIGLRSRFEVDLNRPRDRAVYRTPADAWGLNVWQEPPPPDLVDRSLAEYDAFYAEMRRLFDRVVAEHGTFVVLDLHTYNHRRDGATAAPADPTANPEVNVGTGPLDRAFWGPLIDRFIGDLHSADFLGRSLDVRENIKFRGGHFAQWIAAMYPRTGGVLAVEFKKFFMDEWTGDCDQRQHDAITEALRRTLPGLEEERARLCPERT